MTVVLTLACVVAPAGVGLGLAQVALAQAMREAVIVGRAQAGTQRGDIETPESDRAVGCSDGNRVPSGLNEATLG